MPKKDWHSISLYMAMGKHGHRLRNWLIGIGIFLLMVLVGWQFYKYQLVDSKLGKAVHEKSHRLYSIRYEGLEVDEVGGSVHVRNLVVEPDSVVYERMVASGSAPSTLMRVSLPELTIAGVKTPKALLNKQIEGHLVEMNGPSIEIMVGGAKKDTVIHDPSKDIFGELLQKLSKISMDSVRLVHANVHVRRMHSDADVFRGEDVSCTLAGLLLDSLSVKDSSRVLFSREMSLRCAELQLPSKNKKYKFFIGGLGFESKGDVLHIEHVRIIPQLSENAFVRSFPVQKDRYDFSLSGIMLKGIDRAALWHRKLHADSMVVGSSSFKIYRDLSQPGATVSKQGRYPQQLLQKLRIPVNIRMLVFRNSFIEYKEKNARSDSAGRLRFYDASADIRNVTNEPSAIARDNRCVLDFRARLLNEAPASARIVMFLRDPRGRFNIEGHIGSVDVVKLNQLTEPMGLARLEKGRISSLRFSFAGTDSSSDGSLTMAYEGLKVTLLKKDDEHNEYDRKALVSFLANLIMKKSSPGKGDEPRTVEVHFDRIMYKSFFNLIWKSIFTGMKKNVGVK